MSARPVRSRSHARSRRRRLVAVGGLALAVVAPAVAHAGGEGRHDRAPRLTGRAVLPAETYAPGHPSGAALVHSPADLADGVDDGIVNRVQFPTPSQPVEGFSSIVEGRRPGEYLAMPDNGFGRIDNSADFDIRAYYVRPDFKTAGGGSGRVAVGPYLQFSDPWSRIGFPIQNMTGDRVLTGADIDPESLQRAKDGTFWIGDEFGPWILHFDHRGRLLEAPYALPDGLVAATNPAARRPVDPLPVTVETSRGLEAMAMTPDGHYLYAVLEGTVLGDPLGSRRIYEFDIKRRRFTAQMTPLRAEVDADGVDRHFISDVQAIDRNRLVFIERDCADCRRQFRSIFTVDLRDEGPDGYLRKQLLVDLTAVPDPHGVSLPGRPGDVGLGDPFHVMCESVEALRIVSNRRLLVGCDNNFPNSGRNPNRPDDNELILVDVPRL